MGAELGSVYNALTNEVAWLHDKWGQYKELFAHSSKRVDLLNEGAGKFFRVVQDTLFESVMLHLARLTDKPESRGKSNLTLLRLPKRVPDRELANQVTGLVNAARASCEKVREWRNRHLAHSDLAIALATIEDPLPGISRVDIETALAAVRDALNRLEGHYWNSEVAYEYVPGGPGGAENLVFYLQRGIKSENARHQRFLEGRPLPEDLKPDDDN